ncbi:carboxylesterase [Roridomyces roridus]|uniref:Carboxylesterase n=1 Tax=Roridomyces roridus TaxID=1738132 RepID=A0AAD7C8W2_9AGAR|nr:carboxylesterase [Roridomyces roridus]
MRHSIAFISLLFPVLASAIVTSSGDVVGHPAIGLPAVTEYLGIPFARAPIGELRFAPPVAFDSAATFNATTFSAACPYISSTATIAFPNKTANFDRIVGAFLGAGGLVGEDCLTLNVWAKTVPMTSRRPVMVFFYGGRFALGGTNNPFYTGQHLAGSEDVVVVTVNYRTNIFGFSGAPSTSHQNVGILDQRLALEWVRNNAAAFGGDASRIIMFGQSAGGASVDYHAFAFRDDPIAAGLISHSGTAFSLVQNTAEVSAQHWNNAAVAAGCGSEEDEEAVLACMRGLDFTAILTAGASVVSAGNPALLPTPPFQPTVDNVTVFADYTALAAAGTFAKLPYLLGSLDNEAGFYRIRAFTANLNITNAQWDTFNLEAFTCATAHSAIARAAQGIPTWRYRYFGDWDNLRLFPGSGAYHGSDLEMVFGTGKAVSGEEDGVVEQEVSESMRGAWGAFARDPKAGLTKFGWPVYDPQRATLVRLAFKDEAQVSFVNPSVFDEPCAGLGGSLAEAQGAF